MAASATPSRKAYDGSRRKLVLAFDVGTTYSGISYSILDPGQSPGIKGITRFPAQETISGASKIPTIIYYDQQGKVRAVGAEATRDGIFEAALEGDWYKAEWFKLHLRSKFGSASTLHESIPDLPPNKSVVDVFADFLAYLLTCAASYIQDTHPNGVALWQSFTSSYSDTPGSPTSSGSGTQTDGIHFVLSHPNGWEGKEQTQMRQAAVQAKLIPDTPAAHKRISFVTEGESSLHFAVENGVLSQAMDGEGVVVVDAGGGTIDVSTYKRNGKSQSRIFEEIAVAKCYFHGSVFVTLAARDYLQNLLAESSFLDDLDHITQCFDKTTKPRFRVEQDPQYIKFGSTRDNDANVNIRFGQMKVAGTDVSGFFKNSVDCVVKAVLEQKATAHNNISHVILVGGFAASDWLFVNVKDALTKKGLTVVRPENHVNKAVSDGAISFYLDHYVRTRVAKVTYGSRVSIPYNSGDPLHVQRENNIFTDVDGTKMISGGFNVVMAKNTQVSEEKEFSKRLTTYFAERSSSNKVETTLMCYRGELTEPRWLDTDADNYTTLCTLTADLSKVPSTPQTSPSGKTYYCVTFEVVILFGLTELQAQMKWWENGVERRSAATLIYDDT
ncbi:hypothetical protein CPB83DRAFT_862441 [Crepidotus variabilis]|uniref:Heat shock 70 kDa protein 12A n=1 Tax=Crepidotus variabilis TaxID=179855 RepID=A0A9P6E782_9AGAR|nr:hypothetical protein CPB83DRAFT_862441 [Crepidotus variabilis]